MYLCYFCGSPATSKEHVPPKSFFPNVGEKDYRKNLIKVPSCDAHNSFKSKDDEYIRLLFVALSTKINDGSNKDLFRIRDSVIRSMLRNINLFPLLFRNTNPPISLTSGKIPEVPISSDYDFDRVIKFLEYVAKGIFFHKYKRIWSGNIDVIPHFLITDSTPEDIREMSEKYMTVFTEVFSFGDNKDIFCFEIYEFNSGSSLKFSLDFCFYGELNVTCNFYYA